jgi:hypothetical protein
MSWPKGRPRPKKANAQFMAPVEEESSVISDEAETELNLLTQSKAETPSDWVKGMLLNVRNYGDAYVITLHGEEYSTDRPERALRFTNPALCQDFVSAWYSREHCDPRAR